MPDRHPLRIGWLHQLAAEPWKNGGGVTRTLAQGGHDAAGVAGWRVSLADIVQNGPYSSFAGQTRHSLILGGQGVDLNDAQTRLALRPQQPVTYAGEPMWQATLVDGAVRALNVMIDRSRFAASIDAITEERLAAPAQVRIVVAFNLEGTLRPSGNDRPVRLHAGEFAIDTCADAPVSLAKAGDAQAGTLALIRIWPLAADATGHASPRNTNP